MDNINEFEEIGLESLTEIIKNDSVNKDKTDIISYYRNHFIFEVNDALETIKSGNKDNIQNLKNIFLLFENIEELMVRNNSNLEYFVEALELSEHPIAKAYLISKQEKYLFVEEIIDNIKKWEQSGNNLLHSIKSFRMSPEGRKAITQKRTKHKIDELFNSLLDSYSVAQKAEIFIRIEKYIELGWYSVDNPLEGYLNGSDLKEEAINKLKKAMGKRFFKATVDSEHVAGTIVEHTLSIDEEHTLNDSVFDIKGAGFKDYAIKSLDGKTLFIGDITTQEIGYSNGNSWIKTAKSALKYEEDNPSIKVEVSVSLLSMLYDAEFKSVLKSSFIDKLNKYDQSVVDDWHLIQFLSVLDRDSFDAKYSFEDIFSKIKINFFGSTSELTCNNVLNEKKEFVEKVLSLFERTLDNFNDVVFDAQRMESNADSKPIHLLLSSIKGFEKVIGLDFNYLERYCLLREPLKDLATKVVNANGHIKEELQRTARGLKHPLNIYEDYQERLAEQRDQYSLIDVVKFEKEKFMTENSVLLKNLIISIHDLVSNVEKGYSPILNSQASSWRGNYIKTYDSIKRVLMNAHDGHGIGYVHYNQVIGKKDNVMKESIVCLSDFLNRSSMTTIMNNVTPFMNSLEKIIEKEFKFQTSTLVNTQNQYNNYGDFVCNKLKGNYHNQKEKVKEFYDNFRENIGEKIKKVTIISEELKFNSQKIQSLSIKQIKKPKI